jgi:hypothetical protein
MAPHFTGTVPPVFAGATGAHPQTFIIGGDEMNKLHRH